MSANVALRARGARRRRVAGLIAVLCAGTALLAACAIASGDAPPDSIRAADERTVLELPEPAEVARAELTLEHSGEGWTSRAVADLGERDVLFLLFSGLINGEVQVIDVDTGEVVGEITFPFGVDGAWGMRPLIEYAAESQRLIVLDQWFEGPLDGETPPPQFRVLVFDVSVGLALESAIALEGNGPEGHPGRRLQEEGGLTLSRDEQTLYYLGSTAPDDEVTNPEPFVGIIDLAQPGAVIEADIIPRRQCRPALTPSGESSVILTCREDGRIRVIAPDGSVTEDIDAGGVIGAWRNADFGEWLEGVTATVETPYGLGVLGVEGSYGLWEQDGLRVIGRVLAEERAILILSWRGGVLQLDDERIAVPYGIWPDGDGPFDAPLRASGLVIFNTRSGVVERDVEVEHAGSYPRDDGTIVLVHEHRLDILNLDTMRIERSFAMHATDETGPPYPLPAVR